MVFVRIVTVLALALASALGCSARTTQQDAAGPDGDDVFDAEPPVDTQGLDLIDPFDAPLEDASVDVAREVGPTEGGIVSVRPYNRVIPRGYDPARPTPLVILLHGFGASGAIQDLYFGLGRVASERNYLYANPDGTVNATGQRFWNATDACCDFGRQGIDDVAYINAIIDDMSARFNVDPRRIFVVGHSNGAFMAHRLACELSGRIAAIVGLAGAIWMDPSRCTPTHPISVLQVHGTLDAVISYNGGRVVINPAGGSYPSARTTLDFWARHNRCGAAVRLPDRLDLDTLLLGAETTIDRAPSCMAGAAELWSITGGSHVPGFQPTWPGLILDWLMAHPR